MWISTFGPGLIELIIESPKSACSGLSSLWKFLLSGKMGRRTSVLHGSHSAPRLQLSKRTTLRYCTNDSCRLTFAMVCKNFVEACEENSNRHFPPLKGNYNLKQLIILNIESTFVVLVDVWLIMRGIISILDTTKTNCYSPYQERLPFLRKNHLLWSKNQMKRNFPLLFFGKGYTLRSISHIFLFLLECSEYHVFVILFATRVNEYSQKASRDYYWSR